MTGLERSADFRKPGRQDRMLQEQVHDPYRHSQKLKEPTVCPECNAVVHNGHWSWADVPADANQQICPACQRIRDRLPAGYLTLRGEFLSLHEEEIMNLIHNHVERERSMHPLKRIMQSQKEEESVVVTFTDAHLTRGVGDAIYKAYGGELDIQYTKDDIMLRVNWSR